MTGDQKIIRAKVGLLELAKPLGNVSQACKRMGYSRDSFHRFKALYGEADRGPRGPRKPPNGGEMARPGSSPGASRCWRTGRRPRSRR